LPLASGVEDGGDQESGVALVEAGDGVAGDDRAWPAMLAAMRGIFCSPFELGVSPAARAVAAAAQSTAAVPAAGSAWVNLLKSSRFSQAAWAMSSPVAASVV
jgi:hypothetical protein